MGGFTGFPRDAERFFQQLAAHQSRDWFAAHKADYEQLWLHPMQALLADVHAALGKAYRAVGLGPPKIFRIHRDVRFSKDKDPYKTHIAAVIPTGGASGSATENPAALYLSLGGEEAAGCGMWMMPPPALARWRKHLLDNKKGGEIVKLVAAARARTWQLHAHDLLARAPRGWDPAHPRAELARHKGLAVMFPSMPRGIIHTKRLVPWLTERSIAAAPIVTWLAKNVA